MEQTKLTYQQAIDLFDKKIKGIRLPPSDNPDFHFIKDGTLYEDIIDLLKIIYNVNK